MPEDPHFAASNTGTDFDIGAMPVGVLYAKALLAAAEKAGQTESVLEELDGLVEVATKLPKVEEIMRSGMIYVDKKLALVDKLFQGHMSTLLLNFVKVLVRHNRGGYLRSIQRAARDLYEQMRNQVRVVITTAAPLEPELAERIARGVRERLHKEPVLEQIINPNLIGGLMLRVGDTVFDGSVFTQLEQTRAKMIERSVHEIQSRRDRFSHTA